MIYLIDGYNLLFFVSEGPKNFSRERQEFIASLQNCFSCLHLSGLLVFDGKHRRDEESGRSYEEPLEIIYAPSGQSADNYIVEKLQSLKNPKDAIVVTNDKGLSLHARALKAQIMDNDSFLSFILSRMSPKKKTKKTKDSPQNIERLSKIFEERFKERSEE